MSKKPKARDSGGSKSRPLPRNIILAGFMGSGKSTVGKILARNLGWEFVDVDRLIQATAGKSIPDIFAEQGEEAFRDLETAASHTLAEMFHCVIATGGGFALRPENREAAMKAGEVVLLMASPEQIWHRVERSRQRPLLQADDPQTRIRELLEEREPAYSAIPLRISTDGRTPYFVAEEVLRVLRSR